jgi:hypothetical protein
MQIPPPIREFTYDTGHTKLIVWFEHGEGRVYVGVPSDVHRAFCEASSPGAYFGDAIEDCYPYNVLGA